MTDLVPTREHTELASAVRSLLDKRSDSQAVRRAIEQPDGFDTELWATLCDQMGVAALAIPEEHGGAGFTLAETYVVLEELGRALTPSPLLASVVASAALVAAKDSESLGRIAEGAVATLAWSGITGPEDAPVVVTWRDGKLSGSVSPVLHGDTAVILLVVAEHDDGVGLFSVDPTAAGL
ncbi:MAG: acyl-CoA dehydrogenase family protein, partial [Aeromicrobium sp.]